MSAALDLSPLPTRWKRHVERLLAHTIIVARRAGADNFGDDAAAAAVDQVPCFIDGTRARSFSAEGVVHQVSASVTFPRELGIEIGDTLRDGRDRDGRVLLAQATVVSVDPTNSPDYGELLRTVLVARG